MENKKIEKNELLKIKDSTHLFEANDVGIFKVDTAPNWWDNNIRFYIWNSLKEFYNTGKEGEFFLNKEEKDIYYDSFRFFLIYGDNEATQDDLYLFIIDESIKIKYKITLNNIIIVTAKDYLIAKKMNL